MDTRRPSFVTVAARSNRYERWVAVTTVFVPLAVTLAASGALFGTFLTKTDIATCVGMYLATMTGITVGFHRLFTHRSFQCVRLVKIVLGVLGSMAAQGPVFFWVASHRKHHKTSDEADDPHSPHHHGGGAIGVLLGCWYAHVGWMLNPRAENYFRLIPDLLRDKDALAMTRRYFYLIALGLALPAIVDGLISHSWKGFLGGLMWGGFVRLFLVHHSTWSINSICHLFGSRDYDTGDESKNNALCAFLTLGEGWHNNHHAFPASARHGLRWWQMDIAYEIIRLLKILGLAWEVRLPGLKAVEGRRVARCTS
jgi:stearoyl-CoA desaturase (delta-9 desaturase)